jgi:transposase-like protein
MARRKRRGFTPEQKAAAVVRHLQDGIAISALCEELEIHPNQYYDWQKQALGNLSAAFQSGDAARKRIELELAGARERLARKDWAMAELLEEHIALKKKSGGA